MGNKRTKLYAGSMTEWTHLKELVVGLPGQGRLHGGAPMLRNQLQSERMKLEADAPQRLAATGQLAGRRIPSCSLNLAAPSLDHHASGGV